MIGLGVSRGVRLECSLLHLRLYKEHHPVKCVSCHVIYSLRRHKAMRHLKVPLRQRINQFMGDLCFRQSIIQGSHIDIVLTAKQNGWRVIRVDPKNNVILLYFILLWIFYHGKNYFLFLFCKYNFL